ncbi:MAG: hypothetical protein ACRDRP_06430 [Pseudonocardiaceae bacterium]
MPVDLVGLISPVFVSVRVRVDTEVPPGFVVTRLLNKSAAFTWVASFGVSA